MKIRRASFAGSWYPADKSACEDEIQSYLELDTIKQVTSGEPAGGIAPHAGWYFSGAIACNVIHQLSDDETDAVVVFGMHLHHKSPAYIMSYGAWETPFGEIEVEERLTAKLIERFSFNIETPERFVQDNTIELQLPFIRKFFKQAKIVTIGAPPTEQAFAIGKTLVELSQELSLKIKVIGSTDLTHYGDNYGFSPKGTGKKAVEWVRADNDRKMIEAMAAMDSHAVLREASQHRNACCAGAVAAAIETAKSCGANHAECISYMTSYDKNPGSSFVGYAGMIMSKTV